MALAGLAAAPADLTGRPGWFHGSTEQVPGISPLGATATVDQFWVTATRQLFSNGAGVLRQKGVSENGCWSTIS